jgi:hypothetical protein
MPTRKTVIYARKQAVFPEHQTASPWILWRYWTSALITTLMTRGKNVAFLHIEYFYPTFTNRCSVILHTDGQGNSNCGKIFLEGRQKQRKGWGNDR